MSTLAQTRHYPTPTRRRTGRSAMDVPPMPGGFVDTPPIPTDAHSRAQMHSHPHQHPHPHPPTTTATHKHRPIRVPESPIGARAPTARQHRTRRTSKVYVCPHYQKPAGNPDHPHHDQHHRRTPFSAAPPPHGVNVPGSVPISSVDEETPWDRMVSTEEWVQAQEAQRLKRANRKTEKWVRQQQATFFVSVPAPPGVGVDDGVMGNFENGRVVVEERWYGHVDAGADEGLGKRSTGKRLWGDVVDRLMRGQDQREEKRRVREEAKMRAREREIEMIREQERLARLKMEEEAQRAKAQREAERRRMFAAQAQAQARLEEEAQKNRTRGRTFGHPYPQHMRRAASNSDGQKLVADSWKRYEAGWEALARAPSNSVHFSAIPWPIVIPPRSPEDITPPKIGTLLFSTTHSTTQSKRDRIRNAQLRWHPDRFRRILGKVVETERPKVEEAAGLVARCLNELMARETTTKETSGMRRRVSHFSFSNGPDIPQLTGTVADTLKGLTN